MSDSNEKTTESMELPIEEGAVLESAEVEETTQAEEMLRAEKKPVKKKSSSHSKASEGVMKAASILIISNFIASILGFLRQIVITSAFGMGVESDSFYLAFSIPDMIYNVLVGGGLSSAFIPVFSAYLADNNEDEGYRMASTILNLVAIVSGLASLLGLIFAPQLVPFIGDFSGKNGELFFTLTVRLTRIMFFQSFFMCLVGICMGILQSYKDFTAPSIGSVVYNMMIIVVGLILLKCGVGITGFSIGVVSGAVAHFAIQVFAIRKKEFKYHRIVDFENAGVSKFFHLFWPMLLGISVSQINTIVNKYFGSGQGDSIVTAMTNAISLQQLPINMFGFSIAMSVFPTMVEHYTQGKLRLYKKDLSMAIRNIVFITLPCTFGMIAVREPLVRAMYLWGEFTEKDVKTLSTLLIFYSLGITAYCVRQALLQGFYSIQVTTIPVTINIIVLLLNIVLSFLLVNLMGANGLGLAYSLAGVASMCMLAFMLRTKVGNLRGKEIVASVTKCFIACVIMYLVILGMRALLEGALHIPTQRKIAQLTELVILVSMGVVTFVISAFALKMRELKTALSVIMRKLGK